MQNNSECCNNNCNQGRNCPLRAATPAADMGNPISQLNQHVAAQVVLPEPVTWLIERSAFRVSPNGQDAESNEWLEEAHEPGEEGSFPVYTEQQVRAMLAGVSAPAALDFTKPLETQEGHTVKWITADVIEYKCARVRVDANTGVVYSSPYVGLKIRNTAPQQADARDAERYRWLRDISVPPHNFYLSVPVEFDGVKYSKAQVDEAIDAAIASAKENEK